MIVKLLHVKFILAAPGGQGDVVYCILCTAPLTAGGQVCTSVWEQYCPISSLTITDKNAFIPEKRPFFVPSGSRSRPFHLLTSVSFVWTIERE